MTTPNRIQTLRLIGNFVGLKFRELSQRIDDLLVALGLKAARAELEQLGTDLRAEMDALPKVFRTTSFQDMLALPARPGDIAIVSEQGTAKLYSLREAPAAEPANWEEATSSAGATAPRVVSREFANLTTVRVNHGMGMYPMFVNIVDVEGRPHVAGYSIVDANALDVEMTESVTGVVHLGFPPAPENLSGPGV